MFWSWRKLKKELDIPVCHDGQHGAAIDKLLLSSGVKNLIACDKVGIIYRGIENVDDAKKELTKITNPENIKGTLADALVGANVFIGVSAPGIVS
jgi:malate dehydrogenase (oxaloacetate-decarboxylating)